MTTPESQYHVWFSLSERQEDGKGFDASSPFQAAMSYHRERIDEMHPSEARRLVSVLNMATGETKSYAIA